MMFSSTRFERVYCKQACDTGEEDIGISMSVDVKTRSDLFNQENQFHPT